LPIAGVFEVDEIKGPFQPKPFFYSIKILGTPFYIK